MQDNAKMKTPILFISLKGTFFARKEQKQHGPTSQRF